MVLRGRWEAIGWFISTEFVIASFWWEHSLSHGVGDFFQWKWDSTGRRVAYFVMDLEDNKTTIWGVCAIWVWHGQAKLLQFGRVRCHYGDHLAPLPPPPINNMERITRRGTSGDIIIHHPYIGLTLGTPTIFCEPNSCHYNQNITCLLN